MIVQFCLLMLLGQAPDILPYEIEWLDDPNTLAMLFVEWDEERTEPYLTVVQENWLRRNRLRTYSKMIDGEEYNLWYAPYSWAGDLNHDDITNMKDMAIRAAYYRQGVNINPGFEVHSSEGPGVVEGPPAPKEIPIEVLAELMKILFIDSHK